MSYQLTNNTWEDIDQSKMGEVKITEHGGIAVKRRNETGAVSKHGSVVAVSSSVAESVKLQSVEFDAVGAVYGDGVAVGDDMWIVISGPCEVLLEDGTASVLDNWVQAGAADGRADASNTIPPGNTLQSLNNHFKEIGHCLETKSSGTDVLCKIMLHFN